MNYKELDTPIERSVVSGPAVEALKKRKESDGPESPALEVFLANYRRIRASLFDSLKALSQSPAKPET